MRFLDYIKGNRKGAEAQRTELEAMRDPLLGDAIEGFDAVGGDHEEALKRLSDRIAARTSSTAGNPASRQLERESRQKRIRRWSAAAAAVILVCVLGGTGVWMMRELREKPLPVLSQQIDRDEVVYQEILPPLDSADAEQEKRQEESPEKERTEDIARPATVQQESKTRQDETAVQDDRASTVSDFLRVVPNTSKVETEADFEEYTENYVVPEPAEEQLEEIPELKFRITGRKDMTAAKQRSGAARGNISGFVVDASNSQPMPGAIVKLRESKAATVTDMDGYFVLQGAQGDKVSASMIGYDEETAWADSSDHMLFAMQPTTSSLDEVVVVGYGAQKERSIAGSVAIAKKPSDTTVPDKFRLYLTEAIEEMTDRDRPEGSAVIEFEIDAEGRPKNINVVESTSAKAGREARRLLRNGPDWEADSIVHRITVTF